MVFFATLFYIGQLLGRLVGRLCFLIYRMYKGVYTLEEAPRRNKNRNVKSVDNKIIQIDAVRLETMKNAQNVKENCSKLEAILNK